MQFAAVWKCSCWNRWYITRAKRNLQCLESHSCNSAFDSSHCSPLSALICKSGPQKRTGNVIQERWSCSWPRRESFQTALETKNVMGESLSNRRVLFLLLTDQYLYRKEEGKLQPPALSALQKTPKAFQAMEKLLLQQHQLQVWVVAGPMRVTQLTVSDWHVLILSRWWCTRLTALAGLSNTQSCCSCSLSLQLTSFHHPHP